MEGADLLRPATADNATSALSDPQVQGAMALFQASALPKEVKEALVSAVKQSLGESENAPRGRGGNKATKADRQEFVYKAVRDRYDIIKVVQLDQLFYREKIEGQKEQGNTGTFHPLNDHLLQNMVRDTYHRYNLSVDAVEVKACMETIKMLNIEEVPTLESGVMQITDGLYWDAHLGELTDAPTKQCFRRLFDSVRGDKHTVVWDDAQRADFNSRANTAILSAYYKVALKELEENNGVFPQNDKTSWLDVPYVRAWADNDYDTYMDILRAIASCFLKKKIMGSYFLIGIRRNGKSTFNGLIRTIFGSNNSSSVRLSDLDDPHVNLALKSTIVNLPDEEDDTILNKQATFKSMADHGEVILPVFFSQQPQPVSCDFTCFFPMNHMPRWKGSGAAACAQRCWPIFFTHDFSKEDQKTTNFAEETYTPENMTVLLAIVLALAAYHTRHPLTPSKTMLMRRNEIEEDMDSGVLYSRKFAEHFTAFSTMRDVYEDYQYWCDNNDLSYQSRAEFKMLFLKYSARATVYDKDSGTILHLNSVKGEEPTLSDAFYPSRICPGAGGIDIATLHSYRGRSIITELENARRD